MADVVLWKRGTLEIQLSLDAEDAPALEAGLPGHDPQGETDIEVITSDHRDAGGVKVPFKVTGLQGGQQYLQLTVTDVKLNAGPRGRDVREAVGRKPIP